MMQNCKITLLVILNSIIEKIRMQYNGSNLLLDSFVSIIKRNIINKRNKQKLQHVPYNFNFS